MNENAALMLCQCDFIAMDWTKNNSPLQIILILFVSPSSVTLRFLQLNRRSVQPQYFRLQFLENTASGNTDNKGREFPSHGDFTGLGGKEITEEKESYTRAVCLTSWQHLVASLFLISACIPFHSNPFYSADSCDNRIFNWQRNQPHNKACLKQWLMRALHLQFAGIWQQHFFS